MAGSLLADGGQSEEDNRRVNDLLNRMGSDNTIAWRYKTLAKLNPYMAQDPNALSAMAQSNLSEKDLFSNASALYGMYATNSLSATLPNYQPSEQRAIYGSLMPQSQLALQQMGYQVPVNDIAADSWWQQLGPATTAIKYAMGGVGKVVSAPVISPTLQALTWASDMVAGKPYRTISQLDGTTKALSFIGGAAIAAAGLALLPASAGMSTTLVVGGTSFALGALATSAVVEAARGNLDVWTTAWKNAYNGERMFRNDSVKRATQILDNPLLIGLAQQVALESMYPNQLIDLAKEIAGNRGSTEFGVQFEQVKKIAGRYYDTSDPRYTSMVDAIQQLLNIEPFQNAVRELELGKVSLGRDIARLVSEPGTTGYNFISGGIDAATQWYLDPTNFAGAINRAVRVTRYGLEFSKTGSHAARFLEIAKEPAVMRRMDLVGEAVSKRSFNLMRRYANDMVPLMPYLIQHRFSKIKNLEWADDYVMTGQDVVDWLAGQDNLTSILKGIGVVPGTNYTIIKSMNRGQYLGRTMFGGARDFITGLADARILTKTDNILNPSMFRRANSTAATLAKSITDNLVEATDDEIAAVQKLFSIQDPNVARTIIHAYKNPHLHAVLGFENTDDLLDGAARNVVARLASDTDLAYSLGKAIGQTPFMRSFVGKPASVLDSMLRRVPPGGINLLGLESTEQFAQFADLFKAANIPSFVRNVYIQGMIEGSPSARLVLSSSMIDTFGTIAGFKYTEAGEELLSTYLEKNKQLYSFAGYGEREIFAGSGIYESTGVRPVSDQAVMFTVPDLKEVRKATRQALLARSMYGISDHLIVNGFISKIWKPAVLLRLGFIPRQVAEELLNFVARAGTGRMMQEFGARTIARAKEYDELGKIIDEAEKAGKEVVLSKAQKYLASSRGDVAFPFRTTARVIGRSKRYGSVLNTQLHNYSAWITGHLEQGLMAGTKLDEAAKSTKSLVGSFGKFGLTKPILKENLQRNLAMLAYGNPYSLRRMIIGGVDADIIQAARYWQRSHMTSIMEVAGATNTAPWADDFNGESVLERILKQDGEEIPLVNVRGERVYVSQGDKNLNAQPHEAAVLERRQEMLADPVIWEVTSPVRRYYNADLQEALPPETLKAIFNEILPGLEDSLLFEAFYMFNVGTPSRAMFDGWTNRILSQRTSLIGNDETMTALAGVYEEFVNTLRMNFPGSRVPKFDEIAGIYQDVFSKARLPDSIPQGSYLKIARDVRARAKINSFIAAQSELNNAPEFARDWLMQFIVDHSFELTRPSPVRNALMHAPDYRITSVNNYVYRGVTSGSQAVVNSDGSLRLFFQSQVQLGDDYHGISFSKSFAQASNYSGLSGHGLDNVEGNILLAVDLDEVASLLGTTTRDIKSAGYNISSEVISADGGHSGLIFQQGQRGTYGGAGHDGAAEIAAWQHRTGDGFIDIPAGKWTAVSSNPDTSSYVTTFEEQFIDASNVAVSVPVSPFITDEQSLFNAIRNNVAIEFNSGDWDQYLKTNRNFIDAADTTAPAFLIDTRMIDLSPVNQSYSELSPAFSFDDYLTFDGIVSDEVAQHIKIAIDQRQPIVFDSYETAQKVVDEINAVLRDSSLSSSVSLKRISMPAESVAAPSGNILDRSLIDEINRLKTEHDSLFTLATDIQINVWNNHQKHVVSNLTEAKNYDDFKSRLEFLRNTNYVHLTDNQVQAIMDQVWEIDYNFGGIWSDAQTNEAALRFVLADIFESTFRHTLLEESPAAFRAREIGYTDFAINPELARRLTQSFVNTNPQLDFSSVFDFINENNDVVMQPLAGRIQQIMQTRDVPPGEFWWKPLSSDPSAGNIASVHYNKTKLGPDDYSFFEQFGPDPYFYVLEPFLQNPWEFVDYFAQQTVQKDISERMLNYIHQNIRSGRRSFWHARADKNARSIYRRGINGEAEIVQPGERIAIDEIFYSDPKMTKKSIITYKDRNYFTNDVVNYEGSSEMLWPVLAPAMFDQALQNSGRAIYTTSNPIDIYHDVSNGYGGKVSSVNADSQRVMYANETHVRNTPLGELPDVEIGKLYEPRNATKFDKVVQFGFNKVISPSMDALSRKPIAFHAYVNAFIRNQNHLDWLIAGSREELAAAEVIKKILSSQMFAGTNQTIDRWSEFGRIAGRIHGMDEAAKWTDLQSLAFVRSFALEGTTEDLFKAINANLPTDAKSRAVIRFAESQQDKMAILISPLVTPREFMTYWTSLDIARQTGNKDAASYFEALAGRVTADELTALDDYASALRRVSDQAAEYASEHAIRDIVPFLDSHEIRSQFADHARNFLPFFYAEQNFMTRWARTFMQDGVVGGLEMMRKMQLRYMGLKSVGVIRTDANGRDYFVYPGSELLYDTIEKIFPGAMMPVRAMLETPTDKMIPGFSPQFGAPGVSPLVGMPMDIVSNLFPEAQPLERALLGDFGTTRSIVQQIVPASILNTYDALSTYFDKDQMDPRNPRVASAMMSAIANLEASGHGLPENATPGQVQQFLEQVRNHARIIVVTQAIAGWFTPGPAQTLQVPEESSTSLDFLFNKKIEDPANVFSSAYFDLIKELGIEEGTVQFLELNPNATVANIFSPEAYTISRTTSAGGAPLPSTEEGIQFYTDNQQIFDQYPDAGAWMLPMDVMTDGERSQYAYDIEVISGLRNRRTPEEFTNAMLYREGSLIYFERRSAFMAAYDQLKNQGRDADAKQLNDAWASWAETFKATHPVFAQQLQAGDARDRRQKVLTQIRYLLSDPLAPKASHFDAMKTLVDTFDEYMTARSFYAQDKTARGRERVNAIKEQFGAWAMTFVQENPMVAPFYLSIIQPEAGLE